MTSRLTYLTHFGQKSPLSVPTDQRGSFLVSALVMILFLTAIGLSIADLVAVQYQHTRREMFDQNAQLTAEAGIERSVRQLNTDDSFAGYTSPQQFFDNSIQGKATFTSTVADNSDGKSKTIISTGEIYRSNDTTPYLTRKIKVTVVGTSSTGYSVYTGPGGLILGGSASIVNSAVYTNGFIKMTGASQIGTSDHPLYVDVANYQCPDGGGATYPQLCTDGTQPISLAQSTDIYGTVCATGQTDTGPNDNIQPGTGTLEDGTTGKGLVADCTAPTVSTPTYDRQAQIDAVTTTGSSSDNTYVCNSWPFDRDWPANLELTGNVNIGNSCNITVHGNVYITGNLTIGGASKITVADDVGTTRPVIIVDGTITVGGSGAMQANSDGTGIEFISFKNSTGDPAANITGNDLYNSQSQQTISIDGAVDLPGMIFDAYWGKIKVAGSGTIGSAIGQTVDMSGAGTVTFGTSLASGQRTWTIRSYQRLY